MTTRNKFLSKIILFHELCLLINIPIIEHFLRAPILSNITLANKIFVAKSFLNTKKNLDKSLNFVVCLRSIYKWLEKIRGLPMILNNLEFYECYIILWCQPEMSQTIVFSRFPHKITLLWKLYASVWGYICLTVQSGTGLSRVFMEYPKWTVILTEKIFSLDF